MNYLLILTAIIGGKGIDIESTGPIFETYALCVDAGKEWQQNIPHFRSHSPTTGRYQCVRTTKPKKSQEAS